VPACELLVPSAREVFQPHDVPALIPSVTERESDQAADALASRLTDAVKSANGANAPVRLRPRPRLSPAVSVADTEPVLESAMPTVLV
jgi:hypothetical protein